MMAVTFYTLLALRLVEDTDEVSLSYFYVLQNGPEWLRELDDKVRLEYYLKWKTK